MDCDDIGSRIVTIAIITHGSVTNANVNPDQFNHVRLFSLAGGFLVLNNINISGYECTGEELMNEIIKK